MIEHSPAFSNLFEALTGNAPMLWQSRLFERLRRGCIPDAIALPTGLGKTSVIAIWLIASAFVQAGALPRRLVYVVDRRVVVDQASVEAERLADALEGSDGPLAWLRLHLGLENDQRLAVSTLRGGLDKKRRRTWRHWTWAPDLPAIVVGTVDMIGSRLLFSGYRLRRWSRSPQAGLIGIDSLVVLDEAHLAPAFEQAVARALELQREVSWESAPPARLLPLSATARLVGADSFGLMDEDLRDPVVAQRIGHNRPTKRLMVDAGSYDAASVAGVLADTALRFAREDGARAIVVYCHGRDVARRCAVWLRKELGKPCQDDVGLITGRRRNYERESLAATPTYRAFTYGPEGRVTPGDGRPRFLVCTSAGEVGADLDADAAAMDLVSMERMIQRLGRVNRRGLALSPAPVQVLVDTEAFVVSEKDKPERKALAERLSACRAALEALPPLKGGLDGSPAALDGIDPEAKRRASTPAPTTPRIERVHVEAWALTSLKDHPGRPEVAPFLRGLEPEEPETTVVWREDTALLAQLPRREVDRALDAAPIDTAELLEASTSEAFKWIIERVETLRKQRREARDRGESVANLIGFSALVLRRGELTRQIQLTVAVDQDEPGAELKEALGTKGGEIAGATLIVEAAIGGLDPAGALDPASEARAFMHVRPDLAIAVRKGEVFNLLAWPPDMESEKKELQQDPRSRGFARVFSVTIAASEEDEPGAVLEYWRPWSLDGETGAVSTRDQTLDEHHAWAGGEMERLCKNMALSAPLTEAMVRGIGLHDLGKNRKRWQDGMGAPPDGRPYAKTVKGGRGAPPYRHEFGSLRDALYDGDHSAVLEPLDEVHRDLALHLIASHHGRARPFVPAEDETEIFPDVLGQDALDAAVRYIRCQRAFGPWGLAWLEALFRAADAKVSRQLEEEAGV